MTLQPPRISRRRAAVIVVVGLAVAGALVGALWAWLAPPIHGVVALTKSGERVKAYLGNEADHFFIAAFLLVGLLVLVAVVAAVLLWQWRAHRGPVLVAALAVGAGGRRGCGRRRRRRPGALALRRIDIAGAPVSPEHRVHYVVEAPAGVLRTFAAADCGDDPVSAAVAALVYALMAVSTHATIWAPGRRSRSRCCRRPSQRTAPIVRPVATFAAILDQSRHADVGHRVQQRRPFRPHQVLARAACRRTGRSASATSSAPTSGAAACAR